METTPLPTRTPAPSTRRHERTLRMIGTCSACDRTVARDVLTWDLYDRLGWRRGQRYLLDAHTPSGASCPLIHCPCGSRITLGTVQGSTTESPCDDRCTSARGRKCECSCGGAHHGEDHL